MSFEHERGDRVMAVTDIDEGWMRDPKVPKGTAGVVLEAHEGGFLSDPVLIVSFENGEQLDVDPNTVQRF